MASPSDSARVATNVSTAATTWNVNVGSPVAGTLLIVYARFAAAPGSVTFTGYTPFGGPDATDATDDTTTVFWRWADGNEGATDVLSPTNSVKGCTICWEILGARNEAPAISSVSIGTTTANTATGNSVAPTGAPQDTLYITMAGGDGEAGAYTAAPTNYVNLIAANSGTGGLPATNVIAGGASRRIVQSSSDDPGVFTHGAHTTGWTAYTIAIRGETGAVVSPFTFERFTSGVRIRLGQVVTPIVFGFTTAGDVEGGGADWFGAVVSPFTFGRLADGHRATLAHPTADSVDGNWTDQGGGSDLEGAIDDLTVSDSDYIRSELNPASSSCRVKLEGVADPNSSTGHVLRWRIAKDAAAGKQIDMEIRLYQGGGNVLGAGTEIASFARTAVTETFTTYEEHLSGAQADAITNYADLYLEFEGVTT